MPRGKRLDQPLANQFGHLAVEDVELAGFVCAYGAHNLQWCCLVDHLRAPSASKRKGIGSSLMRRAGA